MRVTVPLCTCRIPSKQAVPAKGEACTEHIDFGATSNRSQFRINALNAQSWLGMARDRDVGIKRKVCAVGGLGLRYKKIGSYIDELLIG